MIECRKLPLQTLGQVFLEITHEQLTVAAFQQAKDIVVILPDMSEQVQKYRIRRLATKHPRALIRKHMVEQFPAQLFQ